MNSQEHALLEGFLDKLVQVHGTRKRPQADAMIRRAVGAKIADARTGAGTVERTDR
jgi:hypothetical protein